MLLGVVSDTHNNLKNCRRIVELFNQAGVDHVIHTGDITQAKTIEVLSQLHAPVSGVFGNNDKERDSLAAAVETYRYCFREPPLSLVLEDRQIMVVHDPLELQGQDVDGLDVVLHGHTHQLTIEQHGRRLTFNPGECAGMMQGFNAVGLLDLGTLKPEILYF